MTLKTYALSLAAIGLITAFAQIILPDGKLKKSANIVFSIMLMLSIIAPIKKLDFSLVGQFEEDYEQIEVNTQTIAHIQEQRVKMLENTCKNELSKNQMNGVEVDILADVSGGVVIVKSVILNFDNLVIPEDKVHININEQAIDVIAKTLSVNKEVIFIE